MVERVQGGSRLANGPRGEEGRVGFLPCVRSLHPLLNAIHVNNLVYPRKKRIELEYSLEIVTLLYTLFASVWTNWELLISADIRLARLLSIFEPSTSA
ncbi:hypothetical protein ACP70R_015718 [Stipagrostis hirtigluma subsp. patula]